MNSATQTPKSQFAAAAVRAAATVARQVQSQIVDSLPADGVQSKSDKSPVTVADFAAQAVVSHLLEASFPGAILVGEESAASLLGEENQAILARIVSAVSLVFPEATDSSVLELIKRGESLAEGGTSGQMYWTLDPIDGTKGFLRGDQYAIALAHIESGKVDFGALGCPELATAAQPDVGGEGTLLIAHRGEGAWQQPLRLDRPWRDTDPHWQQLQVSSIDDPAQARLLRSVEAAHTDKDGIGKVLALAGSQAEAVPMDSQAKYAVLASGGGEVMARLLSPQRLDYREKIWDQAAGSIIVEEAGGRVTDLAGRPLDFSHGRTLAKNRGVLATNGSVHDAFLESLAKAELPGAS